MTRSSVSRSITANRNIFVLTIEAFLFVFACLIVFWLGYFTADSLFDANRDVAAQTLLDEAKNKVDLGKRTTDPLARLQFYREAVALLNRIERRFPNSLVAQKLRRDGRIGEFDAATLRDVVAAEEGALSGPLAFVGRRSGPLSVLGDVAAGFAFLHLVEWLPSNWWPDWEEEVYVYGGYVRGALMGMLIFALYWIRRLQEDPNGITSYILYFWAFCAVIASIDDLMLRLFQWQGVLWPDVEALFGRDSGSSMWFPTMMPIIQNMWLPYWLLGLLLANECFWLARNSEGVIFRILRERLTHTVTAIRRWINRDENGDDREEQGEDDPNDDR